MRKYWPFVLFGIVLLVGVVLTSLPSKSSDTPWSGLTPGVDFVFYYGNGQPRDSLPDDWVMMRKKGLDTPGPSDLIAPILVQRTVLNGDTAAIYTFGIDTMFVFEFVDTVGPDSVLPYPSSRVLGWKFLAPNTVHEDAVQDDAIGNQHLQDLSVGTDELAADAVTSAKIADLGIQRADVALNAIDSTRVEDVAPSDVDTAKVFRFKGILIDNPDTSHAGGYGAIVLVPSDSLDVAIHVWEDKALHNFHGILIQVPDWTSFRPLLDLTARAVAAGNGSVFDIDWSAAEAAGTDSLTSFLKLSMNGPDKMTGLHLVRDQNPAQTTAVQYLLRLNTGQAADSSGQRSGAAFIDADTVGTGLEINGNADSPALWIHTGQARMQSARVQGRAAYALAFSDQAPGSATSETITVSGAEVGDVVNVNWTNQTSGTISGDVTSANTLTISFNSNLGARDYHGAVWGLE